MFERFRELREEAKMSVAELSAELGIRAEIIKSIENGFNAPIHVVVLYAKYFHVTADYLLELVNEKNGYSDTPHK